MIMKRTAILIVLGACGGSRAATDTAKPPAPACVSYEASKAEEKAVADRNEASFRSALAAQGLEEPDFTADYFEARDDQGQEWQVVDATGAKTLLAPVTYLSCGVSNPWRLAMDGSGGVSALMVTPRETKASTVTICGCQADIPITCGGAAPQPVRWRWAMATTAEWKGPLNIVVDHETLTTAFAGRADGSRCPEPIPPP
jgi:hypothetical protein